MATDKYSIAFDIKGIEKLAKWQQKLRKAKIESDRLEKSLIKLTKEGRTSGKSFSKLSEESAKASGRVKVFTANVKNSKNALKQTTNSLKHNTTATTKNTAATKRASAAKRASAKSSKGMGIAMTAMGLSVVGAVASIRKLTRFLINNVKVFAEFERGVKNVTTLMNNDDTGFFRGDLFKGSLQLARDYGFTLDDVNKSMFNAVSAGVSGGEAIKFLNDASKLAVAGVTTLKAATMGLTTVLNAYGLKASEAERVSNILFTTQKFGVTTVEELSKSLGVVVPFAAASGISLEELGAAIAVTTRSGLDAAKTVTALRAAISQMQKPAAESRDLFLEYGIPIGAAEMKAVGFTETLKRLNQVYKDSPEIIEKMFGNVRGLTAIFSLAGDNAESYNEILKETSDEGLTAANSLKALEENFDSTQMSIDRMAASWKELKVHWGDSDFWKRTIDDTTTYLQVFSSQNLSGWQKFLAGFNAMKQIVNPFDQGDGFEESLLDFSKTEDLKKEAKEFEDFLEEHNTRLNELTGKDAMSLTAKDLSDIDTVMGKAHLVEYSTNLKIRVDAFQKHIDDRKRIIADDKAAQDALDAESSKTKRIFNELELASRRKLSKDVEEMSIEGLKRGEYTSVTELEIAKEKFNHLKRLETQYLLFGGATEKQKLDIQNKMSKLRVDIHKKELQLKGVNSKGYNDGVIALDSELATKLMEISANSSLTKSEIKSEELKAEEDYYLNLLALSEKYYASDGQLSKNELGLAKVRAKIRMDDLSLEEDNTQAKLEMAKKASALMSKIFTDSINARAEREKESADTRIQEVDRELEAGLITQRGADAQKEVIEKDSFNRQKEFQLKAATIGWIQELVNIRIAAAANPLNPITFGGAGISQALLLSALATAAYAHSRSQIKAQKFARGGMVHGNSHAQGGERFNVGGKVAELEGGEAVINKRSTAMFGSTLSAMNVAGGGKSFISPNLSGGGLIDYGRLGAVIGQNTNVVLPVESLSKVQNRVKTIESSSKF